MTADRDRSREPSAGAPRIGVNEARRDVQDGRALLVCAYDDDEKFKQNRLEGAMSLDDFQSREDEVPMDQELIFYCA